MKFRYNKKYVPLAQALRKNMTDEEKHLWYDFLKNLPQTVNRQKNIGDYIVDFYIPSVDIVIELDGEQHRNRESVFAGDRKRDDDFAKLGIKVLRFSNQEIHTNFSEVCNQILHWIDCRQKSI